MHYVVIFAEEIIGIFTLEGGIRTEENTVVVVVNTKSETSGVGLGAGKAAARNNVSEPSI
jgi:hypothetical protein